MNNPRFSLSVRKHGRDCRRARFAILRTKRYLNLFRIAPPLLPPPLRIIIIQYDRSIAKHERERERDIYFPREYRSSHMCRAFRELSLRGINQDGSSLVPRRKVVGSLVSCWSNFFLEISSIEKMSIVDDETRGKKLRARRSHARM